jgi:cysteinyl-tRNA synthetase
VAEIWGLIKAANTALDGQDAVAAAPLAAAVGELAGAVGLAWQGGSDEIPEAVAALVTSRDEARAGRDFAGADALRDRLESLGWAVEDTPQGTRIRRKDT